MKMIANNKPIKVLMVSSVWPSNTQPDLVPFLVEQVDSLRKNGVEIDLFTFYGKGNPIRYAWYWLKFHFQAIFGRYDIIHAQFGQSGIVALPALSPLVVTFHGSDLQGWIGHKGTYSTAGRIMQKMSKFVAKHADQVIVVSEHLARYLPANLSINVIPCGIDLDLFHPIPQVEARKQLNLPLDKHLILFAGDPANPIKRFSLAQEACELIKDRIDLLLVVATGIPHKNMPLYLNACNALLLTSSHEGSPTIVKEALACNLPIVSVDVGDVRRRVNTIEGCIICDTDTGKSIADGLVNVLNSGKLKEGFSAVKDLNLDHISIEITKVYQSAMKRM